MNLVLMGPQGSGKGEQAQRLSEEYHLAHLPVGDYIRELAQEDSSQGREINQIMNVEGRLLPDEMVNKLVFNKLKEINWQAGLLFDGYPRTAYQMEELKKYLESKGEKIDRVIYLNIGPETSVKRLTQRRICSQCHRVYNLVTDPPQQSGKCDVCQGELVQRADETPAAINNRLETYHQNTAPLVELAEKEGLLVEIDAEKSIEDVFAQIKARLTK